LLEPFLLHEQFIFIFLEQFVLPPRSHEHRDFFVGRFPEAGIMNFNTSISMNRA